MYVYNKEYLVFFEEFFEVVGASGEHAAVSTELDVFDHHSNVAVFAFQSLLIQQLQEDALMFVVHVLHRLRHLNTVGSNMKSVHS